MNTSLRLPFFSFVRTAAIGIGACLSCATHAGNFVSLHQSALRIALPPAAGSYYYPTDTKIGFKQQYAPDGITGCTIGYSKMGCAFPGGGSLSLPEFAGYQLQYKEFKIYIPAGSRSLLFSGYAPQRAVAAFALRYGAPPVREAALNGAEYQNAQSSERIDTSFAKLVTSKTDQFVVHDGGGTLRFVGGPLGANNAATTEGNWLYVRQLSGSPLYDVQGAIDVDMPQYAAGYAKIQWTTSAYPDPVDASSPGASTVPQTPQPVVNNVVVNATVLSTVTQPLKLGITMAQSSPNIAVNPKISIWIAAFVPANGKSVLADVWFFRRADNKWTSTVPDAEGVAYVSKTSNATTLSFAPSLDLTAAEWRSINAQIFFGYQSTTGVFTNKGKIWPQ